MTQVSQSGQTRISTRIVATLVDALMIGCFLVMLLILFTGGWKGYLLDVKISAQRMENAGIAVLALLLLRKLIDPRTPFRSIPLIRRISSVLSSLGARAERRAGVVVGVMILGYIAIMGTVTCLRHASFNSHAYDLGIFSQLMWSAANGLGLRSSILGHHFLGEHFSPILYLLAPGYRLWTHPFNLLLVQTAALSLAAVPLYALASSELRSRKWGIFFAALYLCYMPMRNVNMYDFHPVALATPLLMLAFYLLHNRRTLPFLLALAAALACKEEIAEIVFIFGVYAFFIQKRRILGSVLALAGIASFFVLILSVIPSFRGAPYAFVGRYKYLGDNLPAIVTTVLTRPLYVISHVFTGDKVQYVWELFGPVAFLSFLSPPHFLLAVPTLLQNLLSDCPPQYSTSFQYTSALTPFIFVAAVFGTRNILSRRPNARTTPDVSAPGSSVLPVLLLLLSLTLMGMSPVWHIREFAPTEHDSYISTQVLSLLPPNGSVSAQGPLVPHLTSREVLHTFPVVREAEYVLLDASASKWPIDDTEYFRLVRELLSTSYSIAFTNGSLLLLEKSDPDLHQISEPPPNFMTKDAPRYDDNRRIE